MSQDRFSRTVVVTNPLGLHLRPAGMLAALASRFQARIEIVRGPERVDGKSVMSIMLLAVEQGGELLIEAAGPDAQGAVDALVSLVESGFSDEQTGGRTTTQG
jgi:phosphotransferase system HPr (HPr) family protein